MAGSDREDFWRTAYGWIFECAYLSSIEEFLAKGKIYESRQLAEAILKKEFIGLTHHQNQKRLIKFIMLLTDGYNYTPPAGENTTLEDALVCFKSLKSMYLEDLAFLPTINKLELDLRVQALFTCCRSGDFKTAERIFVPLDLDERSIYAAAKNPYCTNRDVLAVINSKKKDNPILSKMNYTNFIREMQEFVKYVHNTFPDPWLLQAFENQQRSSNLKSAQTNRQPSYDERPTSEVGPKPTDTDVSSMDDDAELWENLSQITKEQRQVPNDSQGELKSCSLVIEDSALDRQSTQGSVTCINTSKLDALKNIVTYLHGLNRPLPRRVQDMIREQYGKEKSVLSLAEINQKALRHLKATGVFSQLKAHFQYLENKKMNSVDANQSNLPTGLPQPSPCESSTENSTLKSATYSPSKSFTFASSNTSHNSSPKSPVRTPTCQVVCVPLEEDKSIPLNFRQLATSIPQQAEQQLEDSSSTGPDSNVEDISSDEVITKTSRANNQKGNSANAQKAESTKQPKLRRRSRPINKAATGVLRSTRPDTPTVLTPPSQLPTIQAPMSRLRFRRSLLELPSSSPITSSWKKRSIRQKRRAGPGRKGISWSNLEEEELYAGIVKYGAGKWAMIKSEFQFIPDRTAQDLSDKWRTLDKNKQRLSNVKKRWKKRYQKLHEGSPLF